MKAITITDYLKCSNKARLQASNIPLGHNRKREEAYHRYLMEAIKDCKPRKDGTISFLLVNEAYNQGTKKYPHWMRVCAERTIRESEIHETEKTFCGYRKANILAYVKV